MGAPGQEKDKLVPNALLWHPKTSSGHQKLPDSAYVNPSPAPRGDEGEC